MLVWFIKIASCSSVKLSWKTWTQARRTQARLKDVYCQQSFQSRVSSRKSSSNPAAALEQRLNREQASYLHKHLSPFWISPKQVRSPQQLDREDQGEFAHVQEITSNPEQWGRHAFIPHVVQQFGINTGKTPAFCIQGNVQVCLRYEGQVCDYWGGDLSYSLPLKHKAHTNTDGVEGGARTDLSP